MTRMCSTIEVCNCLVLTAMKCEMQGRTQDVSKGRGGGGGSHCVKHYRHGVFATEYCRLFA